MPFHRFAEMTWTQVQGLDRSRVVALLPVGAVEAHGPHLPLGTDLIIAEAMVRNAAERLSARGRIPVILPTMAYSAAPFAAGFPGTLSIKPDTARALLLDIGNALRLQGVSVLGLANAHLDPAHVSSLHAAVNRMRTECRLAVAFPDITMKPWALRLTDEFKSGACHAGQYEGSIVLAERPELVDDKIRRSLPANPASLSRAIRDGKTTFESAGGPQAYFGDPGAATADEGRRTIDTLGAILEEAVLAAASPAAPESTG